MKDVAEQSAVTVVHRITGNIHDVSIITDRVKKCGFTEMFA
jgi:esterase/lipase